MISKRLFLNRWLTLSVLTMSAVLLMLMPAITHAFGVSPGGVPIYNIPAGGQGSENLNFIRSDASKDQKIIISTDSAVGDALVGPREVIFKAGEKRLKYPVIVSAGSLPAGEYSFNLTATLKENTSDTKTDGSAGQTVETAAMADIFFTVTNDTIKDYSIENIQIEASEVNQPVGFSLFIRNKGNVDVRPTSIDIAFVNLRTQEIDFSETLKEDSLQFIKAFTSDHLPIKTNAQLKEGLYTVHVRVHDGDQVRYEKDDISLQIFPEGTFSQGGKLVEFSSDKSTYAPGELAVFEARFENTGKIGVKAKLSLDVMKDGQRVDILTTDEVFVNQNAIADMAIEHRFIEGGEYTIKARVHYGVTKSNILQIKVLIQTISTSSAAGTLIGLTILIVLIVLIVIMIKKHKKKAVQNNPVATAASSATMQPEQLNYSQQNIKVEGKHVEGGQIEQNTNNPTNPT